MGKSCRWLVQNCTFLQTPPTWWVTTSDKGTDHLLFILWMRIFFSVLEKLYSFDATSKLCRFLMILVVSLSLDRKHAEEGLWWWWCMCSRLVKEKFICVDKRKKIEQTLFLFFPIDRKHLSFSFWSEEFVSSWPKVTFQPILWRGRCLCARRSEWRI